MVACPPTAGAVAVVAAAGVNDLALGLNAGAFALSCFLDGVVEEEAEEAEVEVEADEEDEDAALEAELAAAAAPLLDMATVSIVVVGRGVGMMGVSGWAMDDG